MVVVAYTVADCFVARTLDADDLEAATDLQQWLQSSMALAYLIITRHAKNVQGELPAPIGRPPMDRVTITAATPEASVSVTFLVEPRPKQLACRLIKANPAPTLPCLARRNLFQGRRQEPKQVHHGHRHTLDDTEALLGV